MTASERDLRALIDNTDNPMWLVNNLCILLACNRSFGKWVSHFINKELGEGDDVLNKELDKVYLEKFEMCYRLALNGRSFQTVEDMKIDDKLHYTAITFNPVFDDARRVIGVSCFARDITEQRKHLYRIEEQNEALREIAFIESHKVRGPVATIMGLEQLFNYTDLSDPVNTEVVAGMGKVVRELDEIVREVVKKSNAIERQP